MHRSKSCPANKRYKNNLLSNQTAVLLLLNVMSNSIGSTLNFLRISYTTSIAFIGRDTIGLSPPSLINVIILRSCPTETTIEFTQPTHISHCLNQAIGPSPTNQVCNPRTIFMFMNNHVKSKRTNKP